MSDRDEFGSFLIGFIIGGLTGAVVSLLFAPQSGDDTRTYIKDRAIELGDRVNETAGKVSRELDERTSEYRVRANEYADKARSTLQDLSRKGNEMLDEKKEHLSDAVDSALRSAKRTKDDVLDS